MDGKDKVGVGRRHELIAQHLHFPRVIARQITAPVSRASFYDDLISAGNVGLVEAAERFDPECGVKFSTFAWPRIRGAMVDGMRATARYRRSDVNRHRSAVADETPVEVRPEGENLDEAFSGAEMEIDLRRNLPRLASALMALPERERELLQLHYFEGLQLSEIAARMGVHRSWCTRLHQHGLRLLQLALSSGQADTSRSGGRAS